MKVLIVYATKYGTSEKCAKDLSEKINGEVDVKNINETSDIDLSIYDKVIIGGPIYMGMMNKNITGFCNNNLKTLITKKVGLYVCSMFGGEQGVANMKNAFPIELQNEAVTMKLLGGELNIAKMKFFDKLIAKMVSKAPIKEGQIIHKGIIEENLNEFANEINNA